MSILNREPEPPFEFPARGTVYYRYSVMHFAPPVDEHDRPVGEGRSQLNLELWPVLKKTPKGAWIGTTETDKKFVLDNAKKRYACPTIEEAKASFIARKNRQIRILAAQLRQAQNDLSIANTEPAIQKWMLTYLKTA